jgi:ABC-2 type transport system ATP-binding protein
MIEATGVTKTYGDLKALDGVSFQIGNDEIVGLLGPNGAGKTTLLRVLTGYFEPTDGTVKVDGMDVEKDPIGVQSHIGYLPESTPLYPEMLVQEYLTMVAELRQIPEGDRRGLLSEAVWATGLGEQLARPISQLSKGFRQRVGLAQAILHRPKVLILDEPTSGLDPTQVAQVRELIRRLGRKTTVLFSTHILSEVEQVCERAIILLGGKVWADAHLSELQATQQAVVGVAPNGVQPAAIEAALRGLDSVQEVRSIDEDGGLQRFQVQGGDDDALTRAIFRLATEQGWELGELRAVKHDLETVFRNLVSDFEAGLAAPTEEGR